MLNSVNQKSCEDIDECKVSVCPKVGCPCKFFDFGGFWTPNKRHQKVVAKIQWDPITASVMKATSWTNFSASTVMM